MKHSEILSKIEKSIASDVDILSVTRIDTHSIEEDESEIIPGKTLKKGGYSIVELRLILPFN